MTVEQWLAAGVGLGTAFLLPAAASGTQSSGEVQRAIRQSISAYSGSCPCPYSTDRAGRRCGGRSAHSRRGGAAPLCFAADVAAQRRR